MRTYKVIKNAEWNEYITKFYIDGKILAGAHYHTDDHKDAIATGEYFVKTGV